MATTFHLFQDLPAELRAAIWEYALWDEKSNDNVSDQRYITLFNYVSCDDSIAVRISAAYPVLFAVNREARYEAAKIDGCEWMPVYARCHSCNKATTDMKFNICINFTKDRIFLPKELLTFGQRDAWCGKTETPEHYHLRLLAQLLDAASMSKVEHLAISTEPPTNDRRLQDHTWWRGEGLEMFRLGNLKTVYLFASRCAHADWVKLSVEDHLDYHWITDGWRLRRPLVKVSRRVFGRSLRREAAIASA